MDWLERQDLRMQADFYDVDSIATELYQAAIQKLEELEKEYDQKARAHVATAKTEDEHIQLSQEQEWEEQLSFRRKQALGSLPLHLLQLSVKARLERAKSYFDATHPAQRTYSNKTGWPGRLMTEYKERFGIDFERCPSQFTRIEELVLARNAAIHSEEPEAMKEYLEKVNSPRFVNDEDQFWVNVATYRAAVSDAKAFMKWVIDELEKLVP